MKRIFLLLLIPIPIFAQFSTTDIARWKQQAQRVTIIRDNWGIPHIYGKSDADAVFGLLFAQCEDDFQRVEMNYIEKLGRLAEVNGQKDLYNDLLIRMIIDSTDAINDYRNAPPWLKKLLNAFADGVNYYLYSHPNTRPALLTHFKPWYPLLWTDGSIGAISTAGLGAEDLRRLYGTEKDSAIAQQEVREEPLYTGSNGFAIAPALSANGNAMLFINPHVSFYFRPEVHMVSDEGLNAYGAVTWGQFFVYQGFNPFCGWMHTSSQVDVADAYIEKISERSGRMVYEYEKALKPVQARPIAIRYKSAKGAMQTRTFTALYTGHGPLMGRKNGQWLSVRSFNRSTISLQQSWLRTRATSFAAFKKVLDMRGNTSNNTVYADAAGNIGYWHGNFVPRRDTGYDWSQPVDGSIRATEWKGLHGVAEIVQSINPKNGWLQNCNSTPFTVAGAESPRRNNFPAYMAPDGENFRGINAVRVLASHDTYTLDTLISAGYDRYLAYFEKLVPALLGAYNDLSSDSLRNNLREPIAVMQQWDLRSGEGSVATTLAVFWGNQLLNAIRSVPEEDEFMDQVSRTNRFATNPVYKDRILQCFVEGINQLTKRYGTWNISWGSVNRFQRINNQLEPAFDDVEPSIPVGFASSVWGQLPSFAGRYFPNTNKMYGLYGNSFICAVEFGKRIRARSLLAGGESGDPKSPHFTDQAKMYATGQFKEVLFYKEDILKHAERTYHPGE